MYTSEDIQHSDQTPTDPQFKRIYVNQDIPNIYMLSDKGAPLPNAFEGKNAAGPLQFLRDAYFSSSPQKQSNIVGSNYFLGELMAQPYSGAERERFESNKQLQYQQEANNREELDRLVFPTLKQKPQIIPTNQEVETYGAQLPQNLSAPSVPQRFSPIGSDAPNNVAQQAMGPTEPSYGFSGGVLGDIYRKQVLNK